MFATAVERLRAFGASVDGSLLDDPTWQRRHLRILQISWLICAFAVVFTVVDREHDHQVLYASSVVIATGLATVPTFSRRWREVLIAVAFVLEQLYLLRFVGNFTLGPLAVILLTFYQDWVPLVVACALTVAELVVAWLDPGYYRGTRGFALEIPHTGITLRCAAILLAAALALAIWRSGTQFARDQLTGTLSRAGAERALDRELARGNRPAVWVCDIDNFGAVNEHLGSAAGDHLLKQFGARLASLAQAQGGAWFCARLGGDTFLVGARHAPDDGFVAALAHRLEAEADLKSKGIGTDEVPVHFSVGAACAVAGEQGAGLIRAAERNMREAKGRGASRVVVDERIDRTIDYDTELLTARLYTACERGELEVYMQPIVQLDSGAPVGAEALVRWNHPERGLMLPGEFLSEAERDSALMAVVSRTIGESYARIAAGLVARHGRNWLTHGYSYNLAASRLRDPLVVDSLQQLMEDSGLAGNAGAVHLEITEGALMDVEHEVLSVLREMAEMGYKIDLDDFGTGHSSLAHLRDFPLDSVKIDMSFIRSMDRSPTDRAVVQAVADIASASGLQVVAEGVETEEQREMLLAIKPDILAQGWLYAKALPAAEFERWVIDRKRALAAPPLRAGGSGVGLAGSATATPTSSPTPSDRLD